MTNRDAHWVAASWHGMPTPARLVPKWQGYDDWDMPAWEMDVRVGGDDFAMPAGDPCIVSLQLGQNASLRSSATDVPLGAGAR